MHRLFSLLLLVTLFSLLYWRFQLGITRYFDIDEFAHLHWAYNFFSGMKPYVDFLYFFPPGFLFVLSPIFFFTSDPIQILKAARIGEFGVFIGLLLGLFFLVKSARNTQTALLTLIILSFLPIPYDKFLEVRPDTLAAAFAVWGMYFLLRWLNGSMVTWLFLSGFFYGLAMVVVPKVVFFLVAAGMVIILSSLSDMSNKSNKSYREMIKKIGAFLAGLLVPAIATLVFFLWSEEFAKAFYLTTVFPNTSSKILGAKFYMFSSHFFHPNDTYYAEGGISAPLITNLFIYLVGVLCGIKALISFLDRPTYRESLIELLVSLTFLFNIFAFVKIFPLKHAQYWIAIAPFIAFYFADFIYSVIPTKRQRVEGSHSTQTLGGVRFLDFARNDIILLLILSFVAWKGYTMYQTKSAWTNKKTFTELEIIKKTIPDGSYVWDLYGQTIVYKDPHYICCIPYGQYEEAFGFTLPSLERGIEDTNTRYIFAHNEGRLSVLPGKDAEYIRTHFHSIIQDPLILMKKEQ